MPTFFIAMTLPFEIESRLEEIRHAVQNAGAELVQISYRRTGSRGILTFIVDKPGGVTLDDCVTVNQGLGRYFDTLSEGGEALFQNAYLLEVNSPGLDRPLRSEQDFEKAVGERVTLVARTDVPGRTENCAGRVQAVTPGHVEIDCDGAGIRSFELDRLVRASREIKFKH